MGVLESSLISTLGGNATTTLLQGNIGGSSTIGGLSTTSTLHTFGRDSDGDRHILKNGATTTATTATTGISLALQSGTGLPAEYDHYAERIGWTAEDTANLSKVRFLEEALNGLTKEEQVKLLETIEQREQKLGLQELEPTKVKRI